jgi:hypothetical protein
MIGILLMVVGFGWAILGVANIVYGTARLASLGDTGGVGGGLALIFNMVLFILPGLLVGGIGTMIWARQRSTDEGRYNRGLLAKCPQCMGYVEMQARACKQCGAEMNWPKNVAS